MAKIDRYSGIKVGTGYLMGSEIYGKTEILDEIVQQAAERMLQMFDVDITIRFNFDAESGGAYVKDEEWKKYYNKDLIKIGTCLHREFLKPDIEPFFGDTEFRDFDNLDKASATRRKMYGK